LSADAAAGALVEIDGVSKRYGDVVALDDVSASVTERAVGLLGANGAGKSTLMRSMLGLIRPDEGSISVMGMGIEHAWDIRRRLGYMPEHSSLPMGMTARDLVVHMGELGGLPRRVARTSASMSAAKARASGASSQAGSRGGGVEGAPMKVRIG